MVPHDSGDCESFTPKWFYNKNTQSCEIFFYGGCGGNDNKFDTKDDCLQACSFVKGELSAEGFKVGAKRI